MRLRRPLVLCLALASLAFAPAPFSRPERRGSTEEELRKLQGVWVRQSCTLGGERENVPEVSITIRSDRMVGPNGAWEHAMTLDVRASPKRYQLTLLAPPDQAGAIIRGIYRVEGDVLTIAVRLDEQGVPHRFDETAGVGCEVYKRQEER